MKRFDENSLSEVRSIYKIYVIQYELKKSRYFWMLEFNGTEKI